MKADLRTLKLLCIISTFALAACDGEASDGPASSGAAQDSQADVAVDLGGTADAAGSDAAGAGADGGGANPDVQADGGGDGGADTAAEDAIDGGSDTGAEDAAADGAVDGGDVSPGPTSCIPNKDFCFDNSIWGCDAAGLPTQPQKLCPAQTYCVVDAGVAVCLAASDPDGGASDGQAQEDAASSDTASSDAEDSAPDAGSADSDGDAADVDAGPTSCAAGKNFCWDNNIWYCSAAGKPTTLKTACGALLCQLQGGAAVCAPAAVDAGADGAGDPDVADAPDVADTPDVPEVVDNVDVADTLDIADVPDVADVKDTADVPDSSGDGGPTSCDTNKQFCFDNKIWYCSNGKPTTVKTSCSAGLICQLVSGVPACAAPADAGADTISDTISDSVSDAQASCTANVAFCSAGNVWGCSAMGKPTGVISDCASFGWSCQIANGIAKCVAPVDASSDSDSGPAKTCTPNQTFCDGGLIRYCNANGTWGSVKTTCGSGQVCGIQGGASVCILGSYACSGDQCTCTPSEPDSCGKITKAGTTLGYVYGVSKRSSCYSEPTVSECAEFNACQQGQCTSSVLDSTSAYWNYACDMPQFLTYKTAMPVDCRCLTHQALESGLAPCKRPYELKNTGVTLGTGVKFATLQQVSIQGGFVDSKTDEIVTAVSWSGSTDRKGLIVAVEVKTGNRRVISGQYQDGGGPATKGSGPNLLWPLDVQPGPGGKLLAMNDSASAAPEIIAIDPLAGNRTLLWRGGDVAFGQCPSADAGKSVQTNAFGFAVDGDGSMLVGYSNALVDGRGIVRISADGKTCKVVTGSGSKNASLDKGTGNALGGFVQGFAIQAGQVWALTTQPKALWSIDLATGNRTQVYTAASATVMGERRLGWDAVRKLWWISGVQNSTTISAFDPVTKILSNVDSSCGADKLFKLCWAGPININTLNYGGLYVHPSNSRMYFGHDLLSVVEVEPETGNSKVLSL